MAYLGREGLVKDSEKGIFYNSEEHDINPNAFIGVTQDDNRQFRFIVSPEDAHAVDLTQLTRDLVRQMEVDLKTSLEWLAANHYDTDNPHTHLVVRGVDSEGKGLFIHPDYIKSGLRRRATELMMRELGPVSPYELQQRLSKEAYAARYTSLDRILESQSSPGREIDLSGGKVLTRDSDRQRQLLRRLDFLEKNGLSQKLASGRWSIDRGLRGALLEMQKYQRRHQAMERYDQAGQQAHIIYNSQSGQSITGLVRKRGLSDEMYDKEYVLVDATDGNLYYVDLAKRSEYERVATGNIVSIDARPPQFEKKADLAIQQQANESGGVYDPDRHARSAIEQKIISPSAVDAYIKSHLRRLNTLTRKGYAESIDGIRFRVPDNFLAELREGDAAVQRRYDSGKVNVRLESSVSLKKQTRAVAATWLDKRLLDKPSVNQPVHHTSFASEYRSALVRRKQFLVASNYAREVNGKFLADKNLLNTLRAKELSALQQSLEGKDLQYVNLNNPGDTMMGVLTKKKNTAGGRYAIVTNSVDKAVTAIPWKPSYEKSMGQKVGVGAVDRENGLGTRVELISYEKALTRGRGRS